MKYKIEILSREECLNYISNKLETDCVVISINDTGFTTNFKENIRIRDILSLTFDDITLDIDGCTLFNKSISKEIKSFIDSYKQTVTQFIIHCTAGISRSAAVGFVISKYLNGDDTYLFETGRYIPNKLIYETMSNTFGLTYNEDEFCRKINMQNQNNINSNIEFKIDDFFNIITK